MFIRHPLVKIAAALLALGVVFWDSSFVARATKWLFGAAATFDFVYERARDPSWLGAVWRMLANPPPGTTLTVLAVALTLFYWSTRPDNQRMSASAIGMVVCAIGFAGCLFWYLFDQYGASPVPATAEAAPATTSASAPAAVAPPIGSVLVATRYYSTKNKEEVADRLDTISTSINKTGGTILNAAEIAINRSAWDRPGEDIAPFIRNMDELIELTGQMYRALYNGLLDEEREYRVELNAILFPQEPFIEFREGATEFRNGIHVWMKARDSVEGASRNDLLKLVMASRMSFAKARDRFVQWLSKRQELIDQTRRALRS
jgi:hypothetical protein